MKSFKVERVRLLTWDWTVFSTNCLNRCHIYLRVAHPVRIVTSSALLPWQTAASGAIVTAGVTVCDTWTHVNSGSELRNRWRCGAAGKDSMLELRVCVCVRVWWKRSSVTQACLRRQTHNVITCSKHTKHKMMRTRRDSCNITLVITACSPAGAALMERRCQEIQVEWVRSPCEEELIWSDSPVCQNYSHWRCGKPLWLSDNI